MNFEHIALAVAVVSGILVPVAIGAVFPWVLSINSKVAVIVEKLTALAERIEKDFQEHEQMGRTLTDHERRLDDHEHRITVVEERNCTEKKPAAASVQDSQGRKADASAETRPGARNRCKHNRPAK